MTAAPKKKTQPKAAATPSRAAARQLVADEDFDAAVDDLQSLIAEPAEDGYVPVTEDGTVNPVQIGRRGRTPNKMVTIFELDGVAYQIPEKPSPVVTMKFLREARDKRIGVEVATENFLVNVLGQEAFDALGESPEVTEDDVADVFKIVAHVAFGAIKRMRQAAGN